MGYTHYWSTSRDIKNVEWQAITAAAKRIISKARNSYMINLAAEFDDLSAWTYVPRLVDVFNKQVETLNIC